MTTDKALFKKAVLEVLSQNYEQELANCQETAKCSKKHYVRISEIIGIPVSRLISKRRSIKKTLVALLIASALLLAGCTAYIYRNEIKGFIEEFYDTYVKVSYSGEQANNDSQIEEYYSLSYVPEGYKLVSESQTPLYVRYKWTTDTGKKLMFEQMLIDVSSHSLDSEKGSALIITHNQLNIYCRINNGSFHYFWNDGKYILNLYSSVELHQDELKKIIDSILLQP